MMKNDLAGVFPYLVSPINSDGSVKEKVLKDFVEHLIKAGVHGLTPLGSTGEYSYLTWAQCKRIVEIVVDVANGRVPVIAGVAHTSTAEVVRQAQELEKVGADGILAAIDTYFPLKQEQIFSYFQSIAESVNSPILIYNNPIFSKVDIALDTIDKLADIPNIKYLKDASADTGRLLTIMNNTGHKIKVFSASANIPILVMMLGGAGWMAGPACVIPKLCIELYELANEKRWDEAIALQKKLWDINLLFQKYSLAATIKAGLEIQGFDVGNPIPPLKPLDSFQKEELKKVLFSLE